MRNTPDRPAEEEPAPRWEAEDWHPGAGMLLWLLLLVWPAIEVVRRDAGTGWLLIGALVLFAAGFAAVVLWPRSGGRSGGRTGGPDRGRYALLVVVVLFGLALTATLGDGAAFVVIFTSMATATVLPLLTPAFLGLLTVTVLAIGVAVPDGIFTVLGIGFATFISGFVTLVMRRLFNTIAELQEVRQGLAKAAVAEERLRFARDLHDLLGHSLSVIVVKAELIRRLAVRDPAAAAGAAADIETVGRRALAEVRDAVSGYRHTDLRSELDRAASVLTDAGVATTVQLSGGDLAADRDALLAWTVREATTNVLRHSRARHCAISVSATGGAAVLRIVDDGVGAGVGAIGNGLRGLGERVTAAGGTLKTGRSGTGPAAGKPDGTAGFALTVRVPIEDGDR